MINGSNGSSQAALRSASLDWQDTYPVKGYLTFIRNSGPNWASGGKTGFLTNGQAPLTAEDEAQWPGGRDDGQKRMNPNKKSRTNPGGRKPAN